MVYLKQKSVKGNPYYYLVHSFRGPSGHKKLEKYIGREKPVDEELERLKQQFLADLASKNWMCLTKEQFDLIENARMKAHDDLDEEKLLDFCVDFTYNTNAIEGSHLTREDTIRLLKEDKSTDKSFKDEIESFSHKRVFMNMVNTDRPLSLALIRKWHRDMFSNSKGDIAGENRKKNVRVAKFKAPHYLDIDHLLKEFIEWYDDSKKKMHPVELAAMAHLKFVKVHPFMDGNGRIARLLLNYVLNKNGYPMMTVEYKNRLSYYEALDEFDETQEEEVFVSYILDSYIREHATN